MHKTENKENSILNNSQYNLVVIILLSLYLMVDFVPSFNSYTFAEPQWIYVNIINIISLFYIFNKKEFNIGLDIKHFIKNKIIILFLIFNILSAISIFVGYNITEGIVTLVRYIVVLIAFFNIYILLKNNNKQFLFYSFLITIILFIESLVGLNKFLVGIKTIDVETMRNLMNTTHSNKNVFAANILIKIPFVIYCIISFDNWKKYLAIATLLTSFLCIYFLSARTIIIGLFLELIIIIVGFGYLFFKNNYKKSVLNFVIIPIIGAILTFFVSTEIIKKYNYILDKNGDKITLTNNSENRLNTINSKDESLNVRLNYWKSSIDLILKKPLLGCGLGNWKMHSIEYENKWKNNNSNGIHMHNDFLEVAAETGIVNGIFFLLLFISIGWINLMSIIKSQDSEKRLFGLILLASFVGYSLDSFFNFPLSRPTMQIVFVIIMVFSILNYFAKAEEALPYSIKNTKIFYLLLIVISAITLYPNYLMFNFYKNIHVLKRDNLKLNLNSKIVENMFGKFPNLDDTASPYYDLITKYYIKENKLDKALKTINLSNKINPFSLYANSLRVEIFDKQQQYDSVFKYNKLLFEKQMAYPVYYERYIMSLARKKDTSAILSTFKNLKTEYKNAKHYAFTFSYILEAGLNPAKSYQLIEQGLLIFPEDIELLKIKEDYNKTLIASGINTKSEQIQKEVTQSLDYNKALNFYLQEYKKNNSDLVTTENLGICYYQLKKYKEGIPYFKKVVDSKKFQNGKSEYLLAACYYNSGNNQMACEYGTKAAKLNYKDAIELAKITCK